MHVAAMQKAMRIFRLSALLLALAGFGFVAFAFSRQVMDRGSLLLVGAASVWLLAIAAVAGLRFLRRFGIFMIASAIYSIAVLGALVLQFDQERIMTVRLWLSILLFAGLMLTLWNAYGMTRPPRRQTMRDYYRY